MGTGEIEINDGVPKVTVEETIEWLDEQIAGGLKKIGGMFKVAEEVAKGEMPVTAFDPRKLEMVKHTVAACQRSREALIGQVGAAAGIAARDIDETFFGILSDTYKTDITKGHPDPVKRKVRK